MSSIQKLAGQTLWYGVPTIVSRFLNYLLSLLLVRLFKPDAFGVITNLYAFIPFLNIVFTYGLETAFFRYSQLYHRQQVYNTLLVSMVISTAFFTGLLLVFTQPLSAFLEIPQHPEWVRWLAWIVCFDALAVLPFALLRQQERPRRFALVKVSGILINIAFTLLFYVVAPHFARHPLLGWYRPETGVGYVLVANMLASAATLLLLLPEWRQFRPIFDGKLWRQIMVYSLPLVVVGLGGMVNEMISRLIYLKVSPLPAAQKAHELGVFGANYKLAVLITIFIQIFRMAAEPFFFAQSKHDNARLTYARVMKFFVLACCIMFLGISLFTDQWQWLIASKNKEYAEGIGIVPILAMASVFLGIYYNLSIWYKLTHRNWTGARITLIGAALTILLNIWWIPHFGYTGSAWATFICYGYMMTASYFLGQQHYPIPYATKKLVAYMAIAVVLYVVQWWLHSLLGTVWLRLASGLLLFMIFILLIWHTEKHEWKRMPVVQKWVR